VKPFVTSLSITLGICLALVLAGTVLVLAHNVAVCWQWSRIGDCWAGWAERQAAIKKCAIDAPGTSIGDAAWETCMRANGSQP
jgi:hypothetical protein